MNRRDLLLLRTTSGRQVYDLPCECLYMQYLDAHRPGRSPCDPKDELQLGEPEPAYEVRSARELFASLRADLAGAQVLRIIDQRWLADPELRREVDELVACFRANGGL